MDTIVSVQWLFLIIPWKNEAVDSEGQKLKFPGFSKKLLILRAGI